MTELYVVDAPLECWDDLTLRAARVLGQVLLIVVPGDDEMRLAVRSLLAYYGLQTPVHELSARDVESGVQAILKALTHGDVAWLWSGAADAGGVTWRVLSALCERGIDLVSVPGPSTALTVLAVAGLPTVRFTLLGLLPAEAEARRARLLGVADEQGTVVCGVPAGSEVAAVQDVRLLLGDRSVALWHAANMWRGMISKAPIPQGQGQLTLVISGADPQRAWSEEKVRERVRAMLARGRSARDVAHDIAGPSGWPRKKVYAIAAEVRSR